MNDNNTTMIFEDLPIVTVIYLCNTVCGLNDVIINKHCTPFSYDNIIFFMDNIIRLLCFTEMM